jgi:hypothetical protein
MGIYPAIRLGMRGWLHTYGTYAQHTLIVYILGQGMPPRAKVEPFSVFSYDLQKSRWCAGIAWFLPLFVPKLDGLMGKKSMLTAGRSQGEEGREGSQRQRTLPLAKERRPTRLGLGSIKVLLAHQFEILVAADESKESVWLGTLPSPLHLSNSYTGCMFHRPFWSLLTLASEGPVSEPAVSFFRVPAVGSVTRIVSDGS